MSWGTRKAISNVLGLVVFVIAFVWDYNAHARVNDMTTGWRTLWALGFAFMVRIIIETAIKPWVEAGKR